MRTEIGRYATTATSVAEVNILLFQSKQYMNSKRPT